MEALEAKNDHKIVLEYTNLVTAGHGSFGVVFGAELRSPKPGLKVALKRTKQVSGVLLEYHEHVADLCDC